MKNQDYYERKKKIYDDALLWVGGFFFVCLIAGALITLGRKEQFRHKDDPMYEPGSVVMIGGSACVIQIYRERSKEYGVWSVENPKRTIFYVDESQISSLGSK